MLCSIEINLFPLIYIYDSPLFTFSLLLDYKELASILVDSTLRLCRKSAYGAEFIHGFLVEDVWK